MPGEQDGQLLEEDHGGPGTRMTVRRAGSVVRRPVEPSPSLCNEPVFLALALHAVCALDFQRGQYAPKAC